MAENTSTPTTRPGVKTTEFWTTILTVIGSATAGISGLLDPKLASILMAISGVAYTISRGLAKKGS